MPIRFDRGNGDSLKIPNEFMFASNIERDDYFTSNPSRLRDEVKVTVNGVMQEYRDNVWVDISSVIQGQKGDSAPNMLIQYSSNGSTGWTSNLNTALHKYWRWSVDNGVTWSPNGVKFSTSEASSGVPEPYSMMVSAEGKLQLYKSGTLIQEQDETGAWVKYSLTTGTGSIHLGELHSIGSAGENVVTLNTDSSYAWHPTWGAISTDGLVVKEQSARVHGSNLLELEPVGSLGSNPVDYNSEFTVISNMVFYKLDIKLGEDYTGRCSLTVSNKITGKEICNFIFNINGTSGQIKTIPFKYPLWMNAGQEFTTTIKKDNGNYLKVISNTTGDKPYRKAYYRTYQDAKVFHELNASEQATALNALTGSQRLSANAIRDFPIMSSSVLGMAKLGSTLSIDGNGVLNTSISPTSIKIVANELARLSIPPSGGAILVIQQDNGFTYGIEANQDTSVAGNWKQIGTVATNVVSFNGRNGAVVPSTGDYTQKQIKTIHDDTLEEGFFGIDNNGIYWDDGV